MATPLEYENAVGERYAKAAEERESSLCCPVVYRQDLLDVIPQEIIGRRQTVLHRLSTGWETGLSHRSGLQPHHAPVSAEIPNGSCREDWLQQHFFSRRNDSGFKAGPRAICIAARS